MPIRRPGFGFHAQAAIGVSITLGHAGFVLSNRAGLINLASIAEPGWFSPQLARG
jgi:hypothetical protein